MSVIIVIRVIVVLLSTLLAVIVSSEVISARFLSSFIVMFVSTVMKGPYYGPGRSFVQLNILFSYHQEYMKLISITL